jgi:hypothetical protein
MGLNITCLKLHSIFKSLDSFAIYPDSSVILTLVRRQSTSAFSLVSPPIIKLELGQRYFSIFKVYIDVMLTKEKIIDSIKQLPDHVSMEEIIDRIVLLEKIEQGLDNSKKNKVIDNQDLDKHLPKWLV